MDVGTGVGDWEERTDDGLDEGDVDVFVVGTEVGGGRAGFAVGEEKDCEDHFGYGKVYTLICVYVLGSLEWLIMMGSLGAEDGWV